jgi:quercetin 2,3-dioxygenase
MTITIRKSNERGYADHGWLQSYHSFSFSSYYDPAWMGYRSLRVINEDFVAPAKGFGTHGHDNMEIITYVLSGELSHQDSLVSDSSNSSVILPGNVQRMSAGTGIRHSEFNRHHESPCHLLQIWIEPNQTGFPPSYEEKHFSEAEKRGRFCLVASPTGAEGSVTIHQDAYLSIGLFDGAEEERKSINPGRAYYIHIASGSVMVDDVLLLTGDAAMVELASNLLIHKGNNAEVLLFSLA